MAGKVKQEWLLTPREIKKYECVYLTINYPFPTKLKDKERDDALLRAQLAKAEPLIRKDERERIIEITEEGMAKRLGYSSRLEMLKKIEIPDYWQALKEEL